MVSVELASGSILHRVLFIHADACGDGGDCVHIGCSSCKAEGGARCCKAVAVDIPSVLRSVVLSRWSTISLYLAVAQLANRYPPSPT